MLTLEEICTFGTFEHMPDAITTLPTRKLVPAISPDFQHWWGG